MGLLLLLLLAVLPALPNPAMTPGATVPTFDRTVACGVKWKDEPRHVTQAVKRQALTRYQLVDADGYVFDHLIPRSLGGADVVDNIWPQPVKESKAKDTEERLHLHAVCDGRETLDEAQQYFRTWDKQQLWRQPQGK